MNANVTPMSAGTVKHVLPYQLSVIISKRKTVSACVYIYDTSHYFLLNITLTLCLELRAGTAVFFLCDPSNFHIWF